MARAKKLDAAAMMESANTTAAREIIDAAKQESVEAQEPAKKKAPAQKKAAEPKPARRPKSDRVCKLNITLTEEDKDYLRQVSYERTSGRNIVTISDIIAEYIAADRKKRQKAKKSRTGNTYTKILQS